MLTALALFLPLYTALNTRLMKLTKRPVPSLNPYSRCFFGLWLLVMLSIAGFRQAEIRLSRVRLSGVRPSGVRPSDEPSYKARIEEWHQDRVNALKHETGWLNLVGLFWLNEGKNSVGRGMDFDVPLPGISAPTKLGTLVLQNDVVRFEPKTGAVVSADGKTVTEPLTVFAPNSQPVNLANGSLQWTVIKRGDKYSIRARDLESQSLTNFRGIERYSVDEQWRVKARLEAPSAPKMIPILNVLGQVTSTPLAGTLVFEKAGKTYRLDAVGEGKKLFILFGDATNTHATYGSGRFLYADKPGASTQGADQVVTLDFNQAINPPCAFTPYATCPLPPKQNKLTLAVTAGEKRYGDH